jgi:hypothetical protein
MDRCDEDNTPGGSGGSPDDEAAIAAAAEVSAEQTREKLNESLTKVLFGWPSTCCRWPPCYSGAESKGSGTLPVCFYVHIAWTGTLCTLADWAGCRFENLLDTISEVRASPARRWLASKQRL